jgi:hypothetical protein
MSKRVTRLVQNIGIDVNDKTHQDLVSRVRTFQLTLRNYPKISSGSFFAVSSYQNKCMAHEVASSYDGCFFP